MDRLPPSRTVALLITLPLLFSPLIHAAVSGHPAGGAGTPASLAVATYAGSEEQVRSVRALVRSLRERGGPYRDSVVHVVLTDPDRVPGEALRGAGVELVPLALEPAVLNYPLALKAFAAAEVERRVREKAASLAWLDPGVLVLKPPAALDLGRAFDATVRPVSLANTVGILPGSPPDAYWAPIYAATGLDYRALPALETVVDTVPIQPYYNCEVYAVNPELGICAEWAQLLSALLNDAAYQQAACTTFLKRLFLHQAALSAVLQARVAPDRLRPLPLTAGYPFNQHAQLAPKRRAASLDAVTAVIIDTAWQQKPDWLGAIPAGESLRAWLSDTYIEYLELADGVYRIEGSCNAYLVTTPVGSVLIDPAGADVAPEYFHKLLTAHPLQAILLTHAHEDHAAGFEAWRAGADIPVIAQRKYREYVAYKNELAGFFARRNAIWARQPIPAAPPAPPPPAAEPTVYFVDSYELEVGGVHFRMIHTPGETPDHATVWIPERSAVCVGDNYYEYFINNSTFRGTQIRPVAGYIRALDTALDFAPALFLPGHGAPLAGRRQVAETAGRFRDALKHVWTETVRGINAGKDIHTLMREVRLPPELAMPQFYGKVEWTVRGIYQELVGWFDENPASMYALPPAGVYADLVELGGADAIVRRADEHIERQEFVQALHLTDVVLAREPHHAPANTVRLKALEGLKAGTRNYIERIWLDYGIRTAKEIGSE